MPYRQSNGAKQTGLEKWIIRCPEPACGKGVPTCRRRASAQQPIRPRLHKRISLALFAIVPFAVIGQSGISYQPIRPKIRHLDFNVNRPVGDTMPAERVGDVDLIRRLPNCRIRPSIHRHFGNLPYLAQVENHTLPTGTGPTILGTGPTILLGTDPTVLGTDPIKTKRKPNKISRRPREIADIRILALRPRLQNGIFRRCNIMLRTRFAETNLPDPFNGDRPRKSGDRPRQNGDRP